MFFVALVQHSRSASSGRCFALLMGVIFCLEKLIVQYDDAGVTLFACPPAHGDVSEFGSDPQAAV